MTTLQGGPAGAGGGGVPAPGAFRRYVDGVAAVVSMELRQRLRSRGWYIMLGIWFALIGLVAGLTWSSLVTQGGYMNRSSGTGTVVFEVVLGFVLLFGLLVAPAMSANAISGDRGGGTLAILQVTLLRPGQLLWGKFFASWIAALAFLAVSVPFIVFAIFQGGLGMAQIVVSLLMLAGELGVVCALGVGISAVANRTLFSIVVTYLTVAALAFGTLIAFGLGAAISRDTVQVNIVQYTSSSYGRDVPYQDSDVYGQLPQPSGITDQTANYVCYGPLRPREVTRLDRVAWLLAMNPFVVVADAIPYPVPPKGHSSDYSKGLFQSISQAARYAQAGPAVTMQCVNGKVAPEEVPQDVPLWPLGLGLQLLVAAGILGLGWRALRTPAGRLAKGTRIA